MAVADQKSNALQITSDKIALRFRPARGPAQKRRQKSICHKLKPFPVEEPMESAD
jgi:hypothetical protein